MPTPSSLLKTDALTRKRNRAEKRFRAYGLGALTLAGACLAALLWSILANGLPAYQQAYLTLKVDLQEEVLDPNGARAPEDLAKITTLRYAPLLQTAMEKTLAEAGIVSQMKPADLSKLLSSAAAADIRRAVLAEPALIGTSATFKVLASSRVDGYLKGRVTRESLARDRNLSPEHLDLADALQASGALYSAFNWNFILGTDASDSRPEQAGLGASMIGSLVMMLVVLVLSLPIGVAASIYLEEFAQKNWFTDLIEVNISNLAAVPSIVFGILGLAVFIQMAHLPQSAPLVGGLVLTLMTLPTIIISTRAALRAVPPSIRDAAFGLGASKTQTVFHHVLPLAMPGILTGTILGLAQALGETAPLLLIGMVGFIASNAPDGLLSALTSPNSAMPAQIYEWAKRADPAYYERAWGGIILLLVFLMLMNLIAILLRRKFERKW